MEKSWQRMQCIIDDLERKSVFTRREVSDNRDILRSVSGEEFVVRRVMHSQDCAIEAMYDLLTHTFSKEEVDPIRTLRHDVTQESEFYYCAEDKRGRLAALFQGTYFDLSSANKDSLLFVGYFVTEPEFRGKSLALELFATVYSAVLARAKRYCHRFRGVVMEAVGDVEPFANKLGIKRLYFEGADGNTHEVAYRYPPMEYDPRTGEPLVGSTNEHLMVFWPDKCQQVTTAELSAMVEVVIRGYELGEEFFTLQGVFYPVARLRHLQVIQQYVVDFKDALSRAVDGKISLLSINEREILKDDLAARGLALVELKAED